ncbi:bifunctional 2',3'-cyclic-nucleotide 2'-phosphodiesterase/3'-nucleotidase [Vreelandella utahensis]|uniref:bifunctional 2',3'-cyclic-nucleotide 2'-phosphodiesterase/3'-nucleotidase n=1 Tax=Vreelandella halophila TaxID=86177 RepID=UPI000986B137|nr:bifunctional 2',3'-cyclic-nucleotide 2'-phosphodiesterase/3'-nucleotidase [Halomonas utahensis]
MTRRYTVKTVFVLFLGLGSLAAAETSDPTVSLRVMETTDIHAHIMDFDYYRDSTTARFGLVRTASLIEQARSEVANHVLVDNGDLIQGSPLGDYAVKQDLPEDGTHPVYQAMNRLDYAVGNIGNHEFNYGLDFLRKSLEGAEFPYINANVVDPDSGKPVFTPYRIQKHEVVDERGRPHELSIGYIGFVPPQIMDWDRQHLKGRVEARDITRTAEKWVPRMKEAGADVIVAIPHSGLSSDPYRAMAENSVYYLSEVEGVDAIAFGHAHAVFPSDEFSGIEGVDAERGTVNGVVAVMPGRWGSHLGIMDLKLTRKGDEWKVVSARSEARPIFDDRNNQAIAERDPRVAEAVSDAHESTRTFVNRPIGGINDPIYSYLALAQDDPTVELVNRAQRAYVRHYVEGDPDLDGLPVLSVASPFRAGGRGSSPEAYVEVAEGEVNYGDVAALYPFPNRLVALRISGAELREWLECAVSLYNRIDPEDAGAQELINREAFRTYNFDVFEGVHYRVDVTEPARYDGECNRVNPGSQRIRALRFQGEPVEPDQTFLVATNNYRAFGGVFPGTGEASVAFESPDENRTIVADYIKRQSRSGNGVDAEADHNWHLQSIADAPELTVTFRTSPGEKAQRFIEANSYYPMSQVKENGAGYAVYRLDLATPAKSEGSEVSDQVQ